MEAGVEFAARREIGEQLGGGKPGAAIANINNRISRARARGEEGTPSFQMLLDEREAVKQVKCRYLVVI